MLVNVEGRKSLLLQMPDLINSYCKTNDEIKSVPENATYIQSRIFFCAIEKFSKCERGLSIKLLLQEVT